jgi:hypothetical protein
MDNRQGKTGVIRAVMTANPIHSRLPAFGGASNDLT